MVDLQTVCSMCGDVGFQDKIFRCSSCRNRFQHSYCSNFYSELAGPIKVCDWCQYDQQKNSSPRCANSSSSRTNESGHANELLRSPYSGDQIKQQAPHEGGTASTEKAAAGKIPSPRPATRRYKLLKDVMC